MSVEKQDYIEYRLEKSRKTLADAKILAVNKSWNSAINRLYYACFYSVIALLAKNNIETHTHGGVKIQFSLHFVKTGMIGKEHGLFFTDLFDLRHKGDYADFYDFEEDFVNSMILKGVRFISELESLIKSPQKSDLLKNDQHNL